MMKNAQYEDSFDSSGGGKESMC